MGKFFQKNNRFIALLLIIAVSSSFAESTNDDALYSLPPPKKKSNWQASAFAGCALLAVVGGVFAICWSGGGNTPKCHKDKCAGGGGRNNQRSPLCEQAPTTIVSDCMAGACIPHREVTNGPACSQNSSGGCNNVTPNYTPTGCQPPCNNGSACFCNGGIPPY